MIVSAIVMRRWIGNKQQLTLIDLQIINNSSIRVITNCRY